MCLTFFKRALSGLVQLWVYLLATRADCSLLQFTRSRGALRSNTPFKVGRSYSMLQRCAGTTKCDVDDKLKG